MATIHPYKGYLNTKFHFYANGTEDISYNVISLNGDTELIFKSGILTPNIPHFIKFNEAGSYRVDFDDNTSTEIIVEDGYKFGGSKHKKSFIFDDCPWLFVIMHDRTYFYNRETEESYVEAISPDNIEKISTDYIIFSNSNQEERTIYSLIQQKPILNISNIIYHNKEAVLWKENNEIIGFSLKCNTILFRIKSIQYFIDKENNRLLYVDSRTIFALNLFEDYKVVKLYDWTNWTKEFLSFIDNKISVYSLYSKQGNFLYVVNHTTKNICKIINIEGYISSVNGKEFINLHERRNAIQDFDISKIEFPEVSINACYHDFAFYPCEWDIFYLKKTTTFSKNQSLFSVMENSALHSINTDLNQPFRFEYWINDYAKAIITDNLFLLYNCNESFVSSKHYNAAGYNKGGDIYVHNDLIIRSENGYIYTLSTNGCWDNKIECTGSFEYFKKYGVICQTNPKLPGPYKSFKNDIIGNHIRFYYEPIEYIELGDSIITSKGKTYYKKSDFYKFSVFPLAISPSFELGIIIEDDKVFLLDISSNQETRKQILSEIFDSSMHNDVILGENGHQILYRNADKIEVKNIFTEDVIVFDNLSYAKQTNGIRLQFHMPASLQPRIVNPVTGQIINNEQLGQYDFMSPDKSMYADTNLYKYIEYYHRIEKRYISLDEYLSIKERYSYSIMSNPESNNHIIQARENVVRHNLSHFKKCVEGHATPRSDEEWIKFFVDKNDVWDNEKFLSYIVEKQGVAVIKWTKDDSNVVKIKLGKPLWFLNYVSFSYDNQYIAIAGRYPNESEKGGLFLIYDINRKKVVVEKTNSWAVWFTSFNPKGQVAAYSSEPVTYNTLLQNDNSNNILELIGYNFLTFSPDGTLTALSNQGYIAKIAKDGTIRQNWGHQPSCNVYITNSDRMGNIIEEFSDLSEKGIEGVSYRQNTVASVSFSNDNKRIMMVGNDGVVIIRNLHLEKYANPSESR